jgi:hypothetical protein
VPWERGQPLTWDATVVNASTTQPHVNRYKLNSVVPSQTNLRSVVPHSEFFSVNSDLQGAHTDRAEFKRSGASVLNRPCLSLVPRIRIPAIIPKEILVWDHSVFLGPHYLTCTRQPHVNHAAEVDAATASYAETKKTQKYAELKNRGYTFEPVAFETLGRPGPTTRIFLSKLGTAIEKATNDQRARRFLIQRLSVAITTQRGMCTGNIA